MSADVSRLQTNNARFDEVQHHHLPESTRWTSRFSNSTSHNTEDATGTMRSHTSVSIAVVPE